MTAKAISIFTNETELSMNVRAQLTDALTERGYNVKTDFSDASDLLICIGGDGAFLETIHKCGFPETPIVGINTGHLGFFQEVYPDDFEKFIRDYESGNFTIQKLSTVKCCVKSGDGSTSTREGLNEITITGRKTYSIHLNISIGGRPIERFSGDGLLVATSAGSTAYNYSLGGSIVDPRLNLLQVTPLAPMNTTAYRSFTSSILLPSDLTIGIVPESPEKELYVTNDGIETGYSDVSSIDVMAGDKCVNLVRFQDYDFWSKVKDKFL